jgi:hypothetical protein
MSVTAPQATAAADAGSPARLSAWRRAMGQSPVWMGGVLLVLILIFSVLEP